MANANSNEKVWSEYDWSRGGDEWSRGWGGPEFQWSGMLYPRLREFLPAGTILEIAPGYGRWTHYLLPQSDRLIGVDIAPNCVEACRERFADQPQATYHKNDGSCPTGYDWTQSYSSYDLNQDTWECIKYNGDGSIANIVDNTSN